MGYVGGVVALNAVLCAVGYCVLAPTLRGLRAVEVVSYAGVALVAGTGLVIVALQVVAPFGAQIGVVALALVAVLLVVAGIACALLLRRGLVAARPLRAEQPQTLVGDAIATAAAFGLVALGVIVLIGAFRSSPWLDDTWYFWLPKGRALDLTGLDPRLWTPSAHLNTSFGDGGETLTFIRPDNPLGWSILLDLTMRFTGSIDLRAVNGEEAFLLLGFAGAAARLLWGRVRVSILLPALLLVVSAPELLRQAQGGDADVPLAIFLALAILASALWLADGGAFLLGLAAVCAAAALAMKSEALPELLLYLAVLALLAARSRRALAGLAAVGAFAVGTLVPWLVWRHEHHIADVFSLRNALSPSYLGDRTALLHQALHVLGSHFTSVREWSLIVPLAVLLGLAAALLERRPVWLAPPLFVGSAFVFFVWVTWADPEGEFRLVASAYRYVTPPILLAGAFLPLLAERVAERAKTAGIARARAARK